MTAYTVRVELPARLSLMGSQPPPPNWSADDPDLHTFLERYSVPLAERPAFVVFGGHRMAGVGRVHGVLAASSNEFHAQLLSRQLAEGGLVTVLRTEYHPQGPVEFELEAYVKRLAESEGPGQQGKGPDPQEM